jgi:rubredoxin
VLELRYVCTYCNAYVYDVEVGDLSVACPPGTDLEDFPEGWKCPICGMPIEYMKPVADEEYSKAKKKHDELKKSRTESKTVKKDLIFYRERARELLVNNCSVAKVCDGSPDRFCMGQKYGGPIGFGGAGQGHTFDANFQALKSYRLKMRIVKEHCEPDMTTTLFGKELKMPVVNGSMSGVCVSMNDVMPEEDFYRGLLNGAIDFGTIGMCGNTANVSDTLGIEEVKRVDGWGVPVLKPQSQDRLMELFKVAEKANVAAIGIDLDGCGSTIWAAKGKPVYRKSAKDLKELVDSTEKKIMFKGIMCLEDAMAVVDSGAAGLCVSNHGGRVMDSGLGVADVLPEISKECRGKLTIMADGAIRTGYDVLKTIALGADIAVIGRPLARMALAGGAEAVKMYYDYVKSDLRRAMIMTSCDKIADASEDILIPTLTHLL